MSKSNSTTQHKPKKLYNNPKQYNEARALVRKHIDRICKYDDAELPESLFLLIELLCNEDYDSNDRWCLFGTARDHAFAHTDTFASARDGYVKDVASGSHLQLVKPKERV